MSASSSHGRRRAEQPGEPLRRATRAESNRARRERRSWRTRKIGTIFAAMPVVVIAAVGVAMASPFHHHHHNNTGAVACTNPVGTGSATAAAGGGANSQGANGSGYNSKHHHHHNNATPSAAASVTGVATGTAAATGMSTGSAATGATSAAAATGTGTTTSAAAASPSATKACPTATATATAVTTSAAAVTTSAAAAAATPNPNCSLILPANPTSAQGLATPFQLTATDPAMGPCHEANANQSAFAEAAILSADGQLTLYDPLVIDQGTQPAAPTTPAQVPAGASVAIWFGFNGTNLTLQSAPGTNALAQGNCVNGAQGSVFGQFAYCDAPAFFQAANQQIQGNVLQVPAVGTANDGLPCPTTRDFSVVDQDQSDNVVTHYLANGNGQTAQNNGAAMAALGNATDLANGSDNLLLTKFVDPALGCTPWTRPDQSSDGQPSGALPLDELSAAANQQAPVALVPMNDPMALNNNNADANKENLYRAGVDQQPVGQAAALNGSGATYCQNLFGSPMGIARVFKDMAVFQNAPSVDPAMATNLFNFLAMRANQSFTNLGCQKLLNMPNPIALTTDGNGVVTAAVMVPLGQTPPQAMAGGAANGGGNAAATTPAATTTAAPAMGTATPVPTMTMHKRPKRVRW